jgi:NitT/TauT family transport system substrate-binding protein
MKVPRPMLRKSWPAVVVVCIALLAASAQTAPAAHRTATAPPVIYKGQVAVVLLNVSAAAPYLIAQQKGYFKDVGLDLTFVNFFGGTDGINGIRNIGFGFGSTASGLLAVANGVDIKIVGGGFEVPGEQFLVPSNSPIKTIKDLRGRVTTIGVTRPSSNTEFEAQGIAKLLHLTIGKDVKLVYIADLNAQWTAAQQGLLDVFVGGPPVSTPLEKAGQARLLFKASTYYHFPADVSWATSDFIKAHPDVVRAWMKAIQRASQLIAQHPLRAALAYAEGSTAAGFELTLPIAQQALKEYRQAYSTDIIKKGITKALRVLVTQGSLKSVDQVNVNSVVAPGFAKVR